MEKFIPYEKLSKKKRRELNAQKRTVWTINPVTRKPENPKAYNRRKAQKRFDDSGFCAFLFPIGSAQSRTISPGQVMIPPNSTTLV